MLVLVVFLLCYAAFAAFPARRSKSALAGAAVLILAGCIGAEAPGGWGARVFEGLRDAFIGGGGEEPLVNWNVMGLFVGMLVLAELFLRSRAPEFIAEAMLSRFSSARAAMVALCGLGGLISIAVENVAVVLLLAPIALSVAERLRIHPAPLLIGLAICSNVQGTATMIGDPPSMILAGAMKMGFCDFFVYHGRLGIFFAIQAGAIASLAVLWWVFRGYRGAFRIDTRTKVLSWVPSAMLVALIVGLSLSSLVDPDFRWFAGILTVAFGLAGLAWNACRAHWMPTRLLLVELDWDTAMFLVGVFILVGALSTSGWLERLAVALAGLSGGSLALAFVVFVILSMAISGFVDNVPFLLAMIPVVRDVAARLPEGAGDHPVEVLLFGLLAGACMGGNITPIGASANVTALGILRRRGQTVSFGDFMRISVPFTIAAVVASALFIWLVWA